VPPLQRATRFDPPDILENGRKIVKAVRGGAILGPAVAVEERIRPMETFDPLEERILRRIPVEILVLSTVLALGAWRLFDLVSALLVLAGGTLAALGFLWLKQSLNRVLLKDRVGALRSGIVLYGLRLVLICGAFFIIILLFPKRILAFAAGFSAIVLVFLAEGAGALLRMKTWKA
jgi:hypothetical protein